MKMTNKKNACLHLFSLSALLALSGCMGIYEGGFECPPGEGTKCKSISEVNELVNQGQLPPKKPSGDPETDYCSAGPGLDSPCGQGSGTSSPGSLTSEIWWSPFLTKEQTERGEDTHHVETSL